MFACAWDGCGPVYVYVYPYGRFHACVYVPALPPAPILFGFREAVVEAATMSQNFQVQRACVAPL